MNRNAENHFAVSPASIDVGRTQFDRSSSVKFTGEIGNCIPFYVDEVLPGDTFKISTSKVVRLPTLLHPIFDDFYLDTYWFFCPNRLVWDDWKYFCGENPRRWDYLQDQNLTLPIITSPYSGGTSRKPFGKNSVADYMGLDPTVPYCAPSEVPEAYRDKYPFINALPFRAYGQIMNDWFRDESTMDELYFPHDNTTMTGVGWDDPSECVYGLHPYVASRYHDYFSSALPAPQKGPDIGMSLNGIAQVVPGPYNKIDDPGNVHFSSLDNTLDLGSFSLGTRSSAGQRTVYTNTGDATYGYPDNLYADLSTIAGNAFTINSLRLAFQVQKYYEKLNNGSRYIEILKSQFGVQSSDGRLQRSEYLGGNRIPLNINQIAATANTDNGSVGDYAASSVTLDTSDDFIHSFQEHGYLIGIAVMRYQHSYTQGIDRLFTRRTKFDMYWPVFSNISNQPIYKYELFAKSTDGKTLDKECLDVFGYKEAWAEYRFKPDRVTSDFRSSAAQSLDSWHLGDNYDSVPFLSEGWMKENRFNADRVFKVQSDVAPQFYADFYVKNMCTRVMPMYSIPGLADHH